MTVTAGVTLVLITTDSDLILSVVIHTAVSPGSSVHMVWVTTEENSNGLNQC